MDGKERGNLDRHITGNHGEDQFHDTKNLVAELLKNREILTQQEKSFRDSTKWLPVAERVIVYQYENSLKERIRMLTEKCEELQRDLLAEFGDGSDG
jgi:hypothetical protein